MNGIPARSRQCNGTKQHHDYGPLYAEPVLYKEKATGQIVRPVCTHTSKAILGSPFFAVHHSRSLSTLRSCSLPAKPLERPLDNNEKETQQPANTKATHTFSTVHAVLDLFLPPPCVSLPHHDGVSRAQRETREIVYSWPGDPSGSVRARPPRQPVPRCSGLAQRRTPRPFQHNTVVSCPRLPSRIHPPPRSLRRWSLHECWHDPCPPSCLFSATLLKTPIPSEGETKRKGNPLRGDSHA